MNKIYLPVLAMCYCIFGSMPARCEPFIESVKESSRTFHSGLDDFKDTLSETAQRMRSDYDYAVMQDARRHRTNQQLIQEGSHAESQQSFMNSQRQAVNSGGFFNNNSGFGQIGFYGIGPNGSVTFAPIGSNMSPFVLSAPVLQNQNRNSAEQSSPESQDSNSTQPFNCKDPFSSFTLPSSKH